MQFWTKYFQSKYFHRGGKGEEQEQGQEGPKQRTDKGKGKEKTNAATVRVKRGSYTVPGWPLVEPWLRLTQQRAEEDLRKRLGEIDLSSDLTQSDETGLGAKVRHHDFSHFGVLVVWMTEVGVCVGNLQRGYGVADEGATKPKDTKKLSLLQKINRHATTALGEIERYFLPPPPRPYRDGIHAKKDG
jgi:hypothetical protein